VLLELIVEGGVSAQLARLTLYERGNTVHNEPILASFASGSATPPADILDAAARANAARLQLRGHEAAAAGDRAGAAALLRSAAARLRELGEAELASKALDEAESVERIGQTSRLGAKELAYATRRLGGKS
jgi:hypothetical protein